MLRRLSIRNVVLIDKLDLELQSGLTAFTGETGAGKSILLDALGLATGQRADGKMVRQGESQASVTAEFALSKKHEIYTLIGEQGIEAHDDLILRRQISSDGRSRAFINDEPVSIAFLKKVGSALVEIEGQFETHGLLDVSTHLLHLDEYGGLIKERRQLSDYYSIWQTRRKAYELAKQSLLDAKKEEEYLRHNLAELETVYPQVGEENILAQERILLSQREQILDALNASLAELGGESGADRALSKVRRKIERWQGETEFQPIIESLEKAAIELDEGMKLLEHMRRAFSSESNRLEQIEERLYLLRDLARKHRVNVDQLPNLLDEMRIKVEKIENGASDLGALKREWEEAKAGYNKAGTDLSGKRKVAAKAMDQQLNKELPALKLEKAQFITKLEELPEEAWGPHGKEDVRFEVITNPGASPGPIHRIASGGELARFMLALKVTLSGSRIVPTLVFDEVDTGIGGATAAAVGERLKRLGRGCQVLVVTHSPQVAALAGQHLRVKKTGKDILRTEIEDLVAKERQEEIARMLSGATISKEARAAAGKLLAGSTG